MRITDRMINDTYLRNLNKNLKSVTDCNEKVSSGRKYLKASEDPVSALKALKVRQDLSRISLYKENTEEAGDMLTDLETAVSGINSVVTSAIENITQTRSGSYNDKDRGITADLLRSYQTEILDIANSKSSDKYVFGGSDTKTMPFSLEDDVLYYHGADVNSDTGFDEQPVYYDIGLGLQTDASGEVLAGTALDVSNPGSKFFGTGVDGDGLPNNIYNLLGEIADLFDGNDLSELDTYMDKLESYSGDITAEYVNIGQKSNYVEFLSNRFDSYKLNAQTEQNSLEVLDSATGILNYNTQQNAYEAALAMGSKLIQNSLLDYMS
jgi:flagellar hook-associated protein 3 FlgL